MRRISLALALGITLVGIKSATVASRKTNRLARRYSDNYTATWTAINDLYTRIGDPGATGSIGLTRVQSVFLSELGVLPNQSDNNTTLAGVLTWSNNLTDHLIAENYMLP